MRTPTIDLGDPTLFGNDVAEDEDRDILVSYAVERTEISVFTDVRRRMAIARAYKGEGKSALLRLASERLGEMRDSPIVVVACANDLAPVMQNQDFALAVRSWKAAILRRLASEVGATIGAAWTDDGMSLVEEAEQSGFKSRSVVSSILDRLGIEAGAGPLKVTPLGVKRLGTTHPERVLARWCENGVPVWLFVDDVDQNFRNVAEDRVRVAAFFVACREIINAIPGVWVRATVRPNVWTILKLHFESLSHVEQYAIDLAWTEDGIRELLARRIEGYLARNGRLDELGRELRLPHAERDKALISYAFEAPMAWGRTSRPPHVLLSTFSMRRPRWAIELSKVAAAHAVERKRAVVQRDDIFANLEEFGKRRIADTIAEFRSQCSEVDDLIAAFRGEREQLTTDALLDIVKRKILSHLNPTIAGVTGTATARDVAAFLFEIGLFFGRREYEDGSYEHIAFADAPELFTSRSATDRGLTWEIHPVFRHALELRDSDGYEVKKTATKKRRST